MKKPTTKTFSVLDTHDDIIRELMDDCQIAPPQGKYIVLDGKGNLDDEDDFPTNQTFARKKSK
jgi:hypothetical protein